MISVGMQTLLIFKSLMFIFEGHWLATPMLIQIIHETHDSEAFS